MRFYLPAKYTRARLTDLNSHLSTITVRTRHAHPTPGLRQKSSPKYPVQVAMSVIKSRSG